MDKQDTQKPKKLNLKRETVRLLSGGAEPQQRKDLTTPFCTESGPKCDI